MPGTKKQKQKSKPVADPTVRISPRIVKGVWTQISPGDWLHTLKVQQPGGKWYRAGDKIQGLCPFHQDRDPSFVVDLQRRYAKCYSTQCNKYYWDPIRFYGDIQSVPFEYKRALDEIVTRFNLNLPKKVITELEKRYHHREMKKVIFAVTHGELIDAYGTRKKPLPELMYAHDALAYLESRQIAPVYPHLPLGLLPPQVRLEQMVQTYCQAHKLDDLWEPIKEYLEPVSQADWVGSLVFFTGASPDEIAKLKVRRVPHSKSALAPVKIMKYLPDEFEEENGIFGLYGTPLYQAYFADKKPKSCCFMEGEFDALAIMSRQFQTQNVGFFAFSGGGSSVGSLDCLHNFGFQTAYVVADKDDGGQGFEQEVLRATSRVALRIFRWPQALRIPEKEENDPFDAVVQHGLNTFTAEFRKTENFELPYQWALRHAERAMSSIDAADVRYLTSTAAKWGEYVRDSAEQQSYLSTLATKFKIVPGQVLNAINLNEGHEEAFIERIRMVLAARLHVMTTFRIGSAQFLTVFDKRTKEIYDLPLADIRGIRAVVERMTRTDIYRFVREEVGEPGFLKSFDDSVEDGKPFYLQYSNILTGYVTSAITNLSSALPETAEHDYLGAGLHYKPQLAKDGSQRLVLYLVNGNQLYKGWFEDGDTRLVWREMDGPSDGKYIIYTTRDHARPKSLYPQVQSSRDLNIAPPIPLKELYEVVFDMLNTGWDFKHQEVVCKLLTATLLQIPIANCFPRMPQFLFTAEQASGKSSLIGGLMGRTHVPSINIIQAVYYADNFTAAGVRQTMTYNRSAVCLDEFEDQGGNDRKSVQARGVLHLFRGLSNEGGGSIYGSASGTPQEYKVYCPVFLAGIRGLRDTADLSRYIPIELDRKVDRQSPEILLLEKFGTTQIARIREAMPLTMYSHIPEFLKNHTEVKEAYQDGGGFEHGKITRNRDQLYAPMAIMRAAGQDDKIFIRQYYEAYRDALANVAIASLSHDIYTEILYTAAIEVHDEHGMQRRTLNSILSSENPELINETYSGFFFDRPTRYLLVNWATVKSKFLSNAIGVKGSPLWLKTAVKRQKHHISDDRMRSCGILDRCRASMGFISPDQIGSISAFDVHATLSQTVLMTTPPAVSAPPVINTPLEGEEEKKEEKEETAAATTEATAPVVTETMAVNETACTPTATPSESETQSSSPISTPSSVGEHDTMDRAEVITEPLVEDSEFDI